MPASEEYFENVKIEFTLSLYKRLRALESASAAFYEVTERMYEIEKKNEDLQRQVTLLSALTFSSEKTFTGWVKRKLSKIYHGRHFSARLHKEMESEDK